MNSITEEDIREIVDELVGRHNRADSPLYAVLRKTVYFTICKKCNESVCLRGRDMQEDILHDVYLRVWKYAYRVLFTDDGVNTDPSVFARWLYTVTDNLICDTIRRCKRQRDHTAEIRTEDLSASVDVFDWLSVQPPDGGESAELASIVINSVVCNTSSVHISLTWLAYICLYHNEYCNRREASAAVADRYCNATLGDLYSDILRLTLLGCRPELKQQTKICIETALLRQNVAGGTVGATKFFDYCMKKGCRASVSDWINRMNGRACRMFQKINEME